MLILILPLRYDCRNGQIETLVRPGLEVRFGEFTQGEPSVPRFQSLVRERAAGVIAVVGQQDVVPVRVQVLGLGTGGIGLE